MKTTSHLPYQDQLINAYRYSGESEALLRLLTEQKKRGESTSRDLLLGADLLIENGSFDDALNWLDQITSTRKNQEIEIAALDRYFGIYDTRDQTSKKELKWLSRVALQYQSLDLSRKLVGLYGTRGETEEALSLLRVLHRNEKKPSVRSQIQLLTLDTIATSTPDDTEALSRELAIYLAGLQSLSEDHIPFAEWVVKNRELLVAQIPVFAAYQKRPGSSVTARLLTAFLKGWLLQETAAIKETTDHNEFETALLILSNLGAEGKTIAAAEVNAARRAGPTWFSGRPDLQIRFFSEIEDRTRMLETHASMMRMADSYFFFGRSSVPAYPTLQRHWEFPELMSQLGHKELAGTLYSKFYANIRYHRSHEVRFIENYIDFLIEEEQFETAERTLIDVTRHSLGIDLRKIVTLYQKWTGLDTIEEKLPRFELTSGQTAMINDWRNALAEGREMVE